MSLTSPHPFILFSEQDFVPFPTVSELTVAQAATFLDGREGLIHELIEDGLIECRVENGERLVQWDSLLAYQQEEERQIAAADRLFRMFCEAGMSDEY